MKKLSIPIVMLVALWTVFSCSKKADVVPAAPVSNPITSSQLTGFLKGTLLTSVGTYYLAGDVYVKNTDSLIVQPGVTVKAMSGGSSTDPNNANFVSYAIHCSGTLLVNGTKAKPVIFTTNASAPAWPNGYWGGIQCDSTCKYVNIQWAEISYTGGPDVVGGSQYAFSVQGVSSGHNGGKFSSNTIAIVENCKFFSGIDDCLRLMGPIQVSIKGNYIALEGSNDGDNINIKLGVTGDVAYNYIWSAANNSTKLETSLTILAPVTKVNIYNNTYVSGGWRKQGETTAGVLVDTYADGTVYNNLFVNCQRGLRITALAKSTVLSNYNNNMFYTTGPDSLKNFFYPATDKGVAQSHDILNQDPLFKTLDKVNYSAFSGFIQVLTDPNNVAIQSGSPAIGKGNTSAPSTTGLPGQSAGFAPGKDIGAYQSDGTGNQVIRQ
jgi:hypothetical protein